MDIQKRTYTDILQGKGNTEKNILCLWLKLIKRWSNMAFSEPMEPFDIDTTTSAIDITFHIDRHPNIMLFALRF
jgi:hypothetical protein